MNYFPFHIGDYAAHTRHLSLMEDLAYRRLLDLYYTREGVIPLDPAKVARLIGMAEHTEAVLAVLEEFFVRGEDTWKQTRCDKELAKYKKMGDGGRAGANKRWGHTTDSPPIATQSDPPLATKNQEPRTNNQKEKKPARKRAIPLPEGFGISDRVKAWAAEKGHRFLAEQLEAFVSYVKRSGKMYVDWDEALMTAIRENWAKVGEKGSHLMAVTVPGPEVWRPDPPPTPEQKAAADLARQRAMSSIRKVAQ